MKGFLSQQDEINHRRSKFLHYLNARQIWVSRGSGLDVSAIRRELMKPDGVIEIPGEFGKDWGFVETPGAEQGQFSLYQDAKAELDSVSFNAQLAGERQDGNLSGRAIDKLQRAGTIELNGQYSLLSGWELRIYRQAWARIKQFWNDEKWIRVTDDADNLRWVGLNAIDMPAQEWMEEQIQDKSIPAMERKKIAAAYTMLIQTAQGPDPQLVQAAREGDEQAIQAVNEAVIRQQQAQAKLEEPVAISNNTDELDVDIIIDQSFDVINAQEEQLALLIQYAQGSTDVDFVDLIALTDIRGKDELIDKIEQRRAQQAQMAGNVAEKEGQTVDVQNAKTYAEAQQMSEKAKQTAVETELMITRPDANPQVVV